MGESYYKYRQVTFNREGCLSDDSLNYVINPIQTSHYYLPTRERLNDPTEGVFRNQIENELHGFVRAITGVVDKEKLFKPVFESSAAMTAVVKTSGIFSLTKNDIDELMWAHYADSHRGIAIEYDIDLLTRFTPKAHLHTFNVKYDSEPPKLGWADVQNANAMQTMLGYKSPRWSYEKEFRVLVDNINGQMPHDYRAIKSITFGVNFPNDKCQMIIDLVHDKVAKFYKIEQIENSYKFIRVLYKDLGQKSFNRELHQIDWSLHLSNTPSTKKSQLISKIESVVALDPHYLELIQAEKSSIEPGKFSVQYMVEHGMGLSPSTQYTKVML